MRNTVIAVAVGLSVLTGCSSPSPSGQDSNRSQPTSAPATSEESAAIPDVPEPDAGQKADYLAALAAVDPGLAENAERALSRGESTCLDILEKKTTAQVVKNAQQRFTGGNATINTAQAATVVKAVKVWCKP